MVASDNTRDPFYAYGDLDMLEVFREATRILHLDHSGPDWPRAVAATPADLMGLDRHGRIEAGDAADLVLIRARNLTELLARPQSDRTVLVGGRPIDTSLPDYRELDEVLEHRAPDGPAPP
jgi:cytosine/creatinine deaminase